jgi:hypothetical protein
VTRWQCCKHVGLHVFGIVMWNLEAKLLHFILRCVFLFWFLVIEEVMSKVKIIGFEVITAVTMKNSVFLDITLCSPMKVNQCFGGTYCLHLQVWRISQARNQHEAGNKLSNCTKLASVVKCSWWTSNPKRKYTTNQLHNFFNHLISSLFNCLHNDC